MGYGVYIEGNCNELMANIEIREGKLGNHNNLTTILSTILILNVRFMVPIIVTLKSARGLLSYNVM
jgi:hypothetical protein